MASTLKTHTISAGTPIYKGDTELYERGAEVGDRPFSGASGQPVYFAFDAESAKQYGIVMEFAASEPLVLVDLMDADTLAALHAQAPADVQHIMRANFGYGASGRRVSEHAADSRMATYLCGLGYDGYALTSQMATEWSSFHEEMAICRKQDRIALRKVVSSRDEIAYDRITNRDKERRRQAIASKKQKSMFEDSPPPKKPGKSMFDDDDDDDEPPSPNPMGRLRFGGRKRRTRRGGARKHRRRKTVRKTAKK